FWPNPPSDAGWRNGPTLISHNRRGCQPKGNVILASGVALAPRVRNRETLGALTQPRSLCSTLDPRSSILTRKGLAEEGMYSGALHFPFGRSRAVANKQRPVAGLDRGQSVAAAHQGRIQRHHVEQSAKAKLPLHQAKERPAFRPPQARIEK